MKRYFNSLRKSVLVGSAVLALASCNDWKDHYSYDSSYNGSELLTVAEYIESLEGTQDFIDALSSTYMFNGDKLTLDTYWDLLKGDQFITVWVPNKDKVDADDWAKYKKEDVPAHILFLFLLTRTAVLVTKGHRNVIYVSFYRRPIPLCTFRQHLQARCLMDQAFSP